MDLGAWGRCRLAPIALPLLATGGDMVKAAPDGLDCIATSYQIGVNIMAENVLEHRMGADATGAGQYAPVNGLKLYYERYGSGPPLVLLHGGFGVIGQMFGHLIPLLA